MRRIGRYFLRLDAVRMLRMSIKLQTNAKRNWQAKTLPVLRARVAERLGRMQITREAASKRTGLGRDVIRGFMREDQPRMPGLDRIVALADALDCSIDYLVGRTDDPAGLSAHSKVDDIGADERGVVDEIPGDLLVDAIRLHISGDLTGAADHARRYSEKIGAVHAGVGPGAAE